MSKHNPKAEHLPVRRHNRPVFRRELDGSGVCVTARDLAAVDEIGGFRFLTTSQVLALVWPRPSQRRYGESRLRELFHRGWLSRLPLYDRAGPPQAVYFLGQQGRRHYAARLGSTSADLGPGPAREAARDLLFL